MKNLFKMRADRDKLIDEMRSITTAAEARDDKKLTDAEKARFNELSGEVDKRAAEIKEAEATEARALASLNEKRVEPSKGKDYRSLFGTSGDDLGGFKDRSEFFEVLMSGRYDDRLTALNKRAASEGVPAAGGFSVPEQLVSWLFDNALAAEIVRPRAQIFPMTSQTRKVPAWNVTDKRSDISGFTGQWLPELGTATVDTPKVRQLLLTAHKLAIYTSCSREVMEDGLTFGQQIESAMSNAASFYLDEAFLNGAGGGQPIGVIPAPGTIHVLRNNAGQIDFDDVARMLGRLLPSAFAGAVWVVTQTALPELMSSASRITVAAGGSYVPLVSETNGVFTMLGKPLIVSEHLPVLGSSGDILLANFGFYAVGMRREMILEKSNAVSWTSDAIDVRAIVRVDGQPYFDAPIRQKSGDTVSPFIILDDSTTTTTAP